LIFLGDLRKFVVIDERLLKKDTIFLPVAEASLNKNMMPVFVAQRLMNRT
jgi:hypothetical protein